MSSPIEFDHLRVSFKDIELATDNFADKNVIGRGSSGVVYKGQLFRSEKLIYVAVKRLDTNFGEGELEFFTEISILSHLEHENLISIIGFCDENGERIIIKKHEVNGSLDKYLSSPTITWMQRLHVCVGAARALSYVHYKEDRNYGVIHRNIKSSKILLDENWNAKISGFEFSLVNPAHRKHRLLLSPTLGTSAYTDPVSIKTGSVTYKSDSYSFGMVLFEVVCGRLCMIESEDDEKRFLAPLAKLYYDEGKLDELIPLDLRKQMDQKSLSIFSETAYYCLKEQRTERPSMDHIARQLVRALDFQRKHEKPEDPIVAVRAFSNHIKENLEHLKIPLKDINFATRDFDERNCIGEGGFGKVYQAELEYVDNRRHGAVDQDVVPKIRNIVAIKRILSRQKGEQGFLTEIEMLTICEHPNIISLCGFCFEDQEMILVYEHASNGSLDDYLRSNDHMTNLTWTQRLRMCLDIAQGLNYLHTKDEQRIIHRDIKSANILLDHNWVAKIADFGLSKFSPMHQQGSYIVTGVAGTDVYLDPEYANTRILKKESDIYSFGVVLFEILSGKLAYDNVYNVGNDKGLPSIARRRFNDKTIKEIIDPKVMEETDENVFTLNKGPNDESLNTFLKIAHQCLEEKQDKRPKMEIVIKELQKALDFQVNRVDVLKISHKQILLATENFSNMNLIGKGGFGDVYKGVVVQADKRSFVAVKRHLATRGQGEQEFLTELEILFDYKHDNVIGLVGYYNEIDEKIIVYEHAFHGSVDKYLNDDSLTWAKRIKICIDIVNGLDFLHGGVGSQEMVIHRDIKTSNILLNGNWEAKISDFGLSVICPINQHINHVICNPAGTIGYIDRLYLETGRLTKECDIFSLGVVLLEIMCGRLVIVFQNDSYSSLEDLFKRSFKKGKVDEIVFDGIKAKIVPRSLSIFSDIVYQCLQDDRKKRPTTNQVIIQLKEALDIQEDYDTWEPKLPKDYTEIVQMSEFPNIYPMENKRDLYDKLSKGILLQNSKVWFSLSVNGKRNEMISATMFSYKTPTSFKWSSTQNSRFKMVAEMLDISNMNIKIKITPQYLSPGIIYGAYIVFKFCDPRKLSSKPVYVNLKYKIGNETLYSYFATWRDSEWMMIEFDTFSNHTETINCEVLLESFSQYCCGSGAIFVEGVEFRAIDNVKHEEIEKLKSPQEVLNSNSNMNHERPLMIDNGELINRFKDADKGEKLFSLNKVNEKKCHMLPAKMVLYDYSNVKCFSWMPLTESRFVEVAELLAHQVFRIKCKIEPQSLSSNTDYACYLVFKLSQDCHGLQYPVKVRDILRKNKYSKVVYFRSPCSLNARGIGEAPKRREDGLMEVIVCESNSSNELKDDHLFVNLKLRCYEGNMSGLIVCGLEFRPV